MRQKNCEIRRVRSLRLGMTRFKSKRVTFSPAHGFPEDRDRAAKRAL